MIATSVPVKLFHLYGIDLKLSIAVLSLSIYLTMARAFIGQFSFVAYFLNYFFIKKICVTGKFKLSFIGRVFPRLDLASLAQFIAGCCTFALTGISTPGLFAFIAIIWAILDYSFARLRFIQGSCKFMEGWKTCPLVDPYGLVIICQKRPSLVFALSYRWREENASGFCDENQKKLFKITLDHEVDGGFVDCLCKWDDGRMATLDVNKSVYTTADNHYIFADRAIFRHYQRLMRILFFSIVAVLLTLISLTRKRLPFDWFLVVFVVAIIVAGLNHARLYVADCMQECLPGFNRVWLRLEYECRRDHKKASYLFDKDGIFSSISFRDDIYSPFASFLWLFLSIGYPVCVLSDRADMSGLESRSWGETVSLVDEWTGYESPYKESRRTETSQVMILKDNKVAFNVNEIESHIVGGEMVYWFLGRLYKFDGMRAKVSTFR